MKNRRRFLAAVGTLGTALCLTPSTEASPLDESSERQPVPGFFYVVDEKGHPLVRVSWKYIKTMQECWGLSSPMEVIARLAGH